MYVYDSYIYILFFEFIRSHYSLVYHYAGRYYCNVTALSDCLAPAYFKVCALIVKYRNSASAESYIARTVYFHSLFEKLCRGYAVAWIYNCHPRNCTHQSNILKCLMSRSVLTYGNACVSCADFNVCMCISNGVAYNLKGSACRKHCKCACAHDFARYCKTCRSRIHILLCNTHIEKSFGIFLCKYRCFG